MKEILLIVATLLIATTTFINAIASYEEIIIAAKASSQAYNLNTEIGHNFEGLTLLQFYKNPKGSFCKVFSGRYSNQKALIISYRGSATGNDWSNNFNIGSVSAVLGPKSERHGKVHEGFMVSYKASSSNLFLYLRDLMKSNEKFDRVIFTGHSQGGAVAMLSIYDFLLHFPEYRERVELITFGQPRVGKSDFNSNFSKLIPTKNYTRIVTVFFENSKDKNGKIVKNIDEDLVTQVPPTFLGFQHIGEKSDVLCTSQSFTKCHDISTYVYSVNNYRYL